MVRIITDSTSDLSAEQARQLGVDVFPLQVHFGEECYLDGVEISVAQFYEKLAQAEQLPTTSQVNPDAFAQKFQRYVDAGDTVVGIFLSSKMSGTCQSALIAREMVDQEKIFVVDSHTVTFALGLMVTEAVKLRDQGLSAGEIAARMEELSHKVRLLAMVDTLKYLKMGGRISAATAAVGGLLGINPIISVGDSGTVESAGKARGRKAAFRWIAGRMEQEPADPAHGISFGHSNAPEAMEECISFFADRLDTEHALRSDIGAVVGTHAGPGAAGIAYFVP